MQDTVNQNRDKFIGGSDIGVILGISPFKTRWELLQEKAGIRKDEFTGNAYTFFGNTMEAKIREYINNTYFPFDPFVEGKHTEEGDIIGFREHTDGENSDTIFECKTTGEYDEKKREIYLSQLLWYMFRTQKKNGLLAVYIRPDDLSEEFDENRLTQERIDFDANLEFVHRINTEVKRFIGDLLLLKDNPFLSEEDLLPQELVEVAQQVVAFESRLAEIKAEEKRIKEEKANLYKAMMKANIKKWETLNGYKITRVDEILPSEKEIEEFNEDKFAEDNPDLYKKYTEKKVVAVSGKAGYVKITPPKEAK